MTPAAYSRHFVVHLMRQYLKPLPTQLALSSSRTVHIPPQILLWSLFGNILFQSTGSTQANSFFSTLWSSDCKVTQEDCVALPWFAPIILQYTTSYAQSTCKKFNSKTCQWLSSQATFRWNQTRTTTIFFWLVIPIIQFLDHSGGCNGLYLDIDIIWKFCSLNAGSCRFRRWEQLFSKGEIVAVIYFFRISILTFSYTSFIAEKLSISFKYTLTLTTFSHDEPAASKTFPRFLMHWAYWRYIDWRVRAQKSNVSYSMLFNAAFDYFSCLVCWNLTTQKDQTRYFRCMG